MSGPARAAALAWAFLSIVQAPPLPAQETDPEDEPREVGLVERAGARLAQLDVTVIGDTETIAALRPEDFEVKINQTTLKDFQLDRLCALPRSEPAVAAASDSRMPPAVPPQHASFLFYFDQPHLTMNGRLRSLKVARDLIRRLVVRDHRATLVSNADQLEVVQPMTDDRERLLEALDRLEQDRTQWHFFAEQEVDRVTKVIRVLNEDGEMNRAISTARRYQNDERWMADRSLRRLRLALGQLVELRPPKVVIFFADTLRSNPGEHYLSFFGDVLRGGSPLLDIIDSSAAMGGLAFDGVVNEASAQGIRIYTVQAEGLVQHYDRAFPTTGAMFQTRSVPTPSKARFEHAQNTLNSMAAETGGDAFLNGARAELIAQRILEDSSCLFLISFDPSEFHEDRPLRAVVRVRRDDVDVRVRGRLVVQSASARRTSELVHAFSTADGMREPFDVRTCVIPTGFEKGEFSALLQVSVPGAPLHGATWDLGASVLAGEKVREEASGRLSVSGPGVPVVLEKEMRFKPGEYEIVSVAHEAVSGMITSNESSVAWPDPNDARATVGPIAVVQPVEAAFLREGTSRTSGSLARDVGEPVRGDRATALIGLVCRGKKQEGPFDVRRSLTGESEIEFPELSFDLETDRCAQVRDLVPPDTLGPGRYRYEVTVSAGGESLQRGQREFVVAGP